MDLLIVGLCVGLATLSGLPEARARRTLAPEHAAVAARAGEFGLARLLLLCPFLAAGVFLSNRFGATGTIAYVIAAVLPLAVYSVTLSVVSIARLRRGMAPPDYMRAFALSAVLELSVCVGILVLFWRE